MKVLFRRLVGAVAALHSKVCLAEPHHASRGRPA
jgi:hypothetical protein